MDYSEKKTADWMKKNIQNSKRNKGFYVGIAARVSQKKVVSDKEKAIIEDGKRRKEIQEFIRTKVEQGYPPDQLLKRLCFIFGKSEYQPYRKYFKTWIMNAVEKQGKKQKGELDKEEKE